MSDEVMNDEFPNENQRLAVCNNLAEGKAVSVHDSVLTAIRNRKDHQAEFGYGITTADQYVKRVLKECGGTIAAEVFKVDDDGSFMERAANTLVYANPDMVVEEKETNSSSIMLLPDGTDLPKHTLMTMQHVLTTSREDRDKDVLETEGAVLDPKAPLLWQHMHTLPIGKVIATVAHTPKMLKVVTVLLDLNDVTNDAAKLIEADALRFSHGFRALEFEERKKEGMEFPGFRITKFEIMEASLVSVPSNTDAEMELFSNNKLKSDFFKAHAKHYLSTRPTQVVGTNVHGETQMTLKLGDAEMTVKAQNVDDAMVAMKAMTNVDDPDPKRAVPFKRTPVSKSTTWDKDAAVRRLRSWAGVNEDDSNDSTDGAWSKYSQGFARVMGNGDTFGSFSLPHHDIQDGRLVAVRPALSAAIAAVNGARGGVRFESEGERKAVYQHLAKHFDDIEDVDAPPLKELEMIDEKGGRVISARNLTVLKDVHSDLEHLGQMDLSRGAHALIERSIGKLHGVITAAEHMDDEDDKPKPKPKPEDEKPDKQVETITVTRTPTAEEAARILLACDDDELLHRVYNVIGTMDHIAELDECASTYRELIS